MLDFLKKLLFSNRYSLLILLIFSLVINLVRDYNIFLSYIFLLALYLIIGIVVEIVLEKYFPKFADKKPSGNETGRGAQSRNTQSRNTQSRSAVRASNNRTGNSSAESTDENIRNTRSEGTVRNVPERRRTGSAPVRRTDRSVRSNDSVNENEQRRSSQQRGVGSELPDRRSGVADHTAIRERAVRNMSGSGAVSGSEGEPAPKVTSSYIRSAGSIPRDMEKKLVRTASDFNSIMNGSERLSSEEQRMRGFRQSGTSPYIQNSEELYTNKGKTDAESSKSDDTKSEAIDEKASEKRGSEGRTDTGAAAENRRSVPEASYDEYYDDDYAKSIDSISRETELIKDKIDDIKTSRSGTRRRTPLIYTDDDFEYVKPRPARQENMGVRQENVRTGQENVPARQESKAQSQGADRNKPSDSVVSDIEKINRLFNHHNSDDTDIDSANTGGSGRSGSNGGDDRSGLFGRFKKKR